MNAIAALTKVTAVSHGVPFHNSLRPENERDRAVRAYHEETRTSPRRTHAEAARKVELLGVNPNGAELYRRKVKRLAEALTEDPSSQEAVIALRSLIGKSCSLGEARRGQCHATLTTWDALGPG